jgi:hypothetical protein
MSFTDRTMNRRSLMTGSTAAIAAGGFAAVLKAQDATPEEASPPADSGMPPIPDGAVVVAEGLWNPGDIAFGDDGTLYIAETGAFGGEEGPGPVSATPNADGTPPMGPAPIVPPQISQVTADGTQSVFTDEVGGVGIGVANGTVYVSNGGGSVGSGATPQPEENTVSAVDIASGDVRLLAQLGPNEVANNPDGLDVNPNLYGLDIAADGTIYQTDAGGNTIYTIDPATGDFELFAVVPNLTDLTGATPTAEEQAMQPGPRQPVPTSVVIDDAGNINVFLLGESWSGPSILVFAPDGTYTVGISGLSMIVNATLGPDGLMYVSQLTADFSGDVPAPGAVMRIKADGSVETVVDGLFLPHGIAFDADGNLFVVTNSIISGPDAPLGMVLRVDGIAVV